MLTAIYGADRRHKLSFLLGLVLLAMVIAVAVLTASASAGGSSGGPASPAPVLDAKMQTMDHGDGCCCCP
jgi:hypothetical protein